LTIDAKDCQELGRFWAAALDWEMVKVTEESTYLVPKEAVGKDHSIPGLLLFRARGHKITKNRMHLDLRPDDQAAEIVRLEGLGARRVEIGQTGAEDWVVMADPEGNEFCVLKARR
jgi:predicted enzyme related to lactoylglutathione lyase